MAKSLCREFKSFFKQFDYFGVTLNFQMKDDNNYKSKFGGFIFFFYLIFAIVYCFIQSISFLNNSQVNIIYNEESGLTAPEINFNNYSMSMAVGLDAGNPVLNVLADKYFAVKLNSIMQLKTNGTVKKTKISIPLQKCNYTDFNNKINDSFDVNGLKYFLCPDLQNNTINGLYTNDEFKYFELVISIRPESFNKTEEIKNFLMDNEVKSNFFYIDTSVSILNYDEPVMQYLNSKFVTLNWRFYKKLNLDFHPFVFESDKNIFFEKGDTLEFLVIGQHYEYFLDLGEDRNESANTLCKTYFRSSTDKRFFKRVYLKLPDFLANISSVISSVLLILYIFVTYINEFKAQQAIMKKILLFKDNLHQKKFESITYLKEKFTGDANCYVNNSLNKNKNKEESNPKFILILF